VTSTVSTLWAKALVDHPDASKPLASSGGNVAVSVLTLVQLIVSLAADVCVMRYGGVEPHSSSSSSSSGGGGGGGGGSSGGSGVGSDSSPPLPAGASAVPAPAPAAATAASPPPRRYSWLEIVLAFTPISIFVIMSKLTTYLSYYYVSVSLSHTAKASEPIFNVLVAAVIFGEFHSAHVYLSLLPIALGITLASVTDFSYNHIGFAWSVASALMKVLQNIYTKKLMLTGRFSFWEIHLFCGAASLAIFAPAVLLQCLSARVNPFARCGSIAAAAARARSALLSEVRCRCRRVLARGCPPTRPFSLPPPSSQLCRSFPIVSLFLSSLLQYASSVASYRVLHLVSHLSYTIITTAKRLVVILSGMLLASRAWSALNTTGVTLAVLGILAYHIVEDEKPSSWPDNPLSWRSWAACLAAELCERRPAPKAKVDDEESAASDGGGGGGSGGGGSASFWAAAAAAAALPPQTQPPPAAAALLSAAALARADFSALLQRSGSGAPPLLPAMPNALLWPSPAPALHARWPATAEQRGRDAAAAEASSGGGSGGGSGGDGVSAGGGSSSGGGGGGSSSSSAASSWLTGGLRGRGHIPTLLAKASFLGGSAPPPPAAMLQEPAPPLSASYDAGAESSARPPGSPTVRSRGGGGAGELDAAVAAADAAVSGGGAGSGSSNGGGGGGTPKRE